MLEDINHLTLAVTDVRRSFDFYYKLLGFKPLVLWRDGAYFLVGPFWFCLNYDPHYVAQPSCTHYAFSVDSNAFESIAQRIQDAGTAIYKDNTSPGHSLYFLDPDGHQLEIHAGNWQARIEAKKLNCGQWQEVEWFI